MPTKAELRARLTLDKSLFDRGIAAAQAGASLMSRGMASIGKVGAEGLAVAGAAAIGLGLALAYGTKKAFDLGGSLKNMSNISGRSVKEILLMRRVLEDAGVSMGKIDRYILTGRDKGNVIGRVLQQATRKDWQDAAESVGEQANILQQNASAFKRISDLMGRSGDKLQGFFVGVADRVSKTLGPLLEKLDKIDLAGMGQKFGDGIVKGAQSLVGLFANPSLLFSTAILYFQAGILGLGNVLIAVFKSSTEFFKDGMFNVIGGIGGALVSTLLSSFEKPLAFLRAGIADVLDVDNSQWHTDLQIKVKTALRDSVGTNMSGGLNSLGKAYQKDIDEFKGKKAGTSFDARYIKALGEVRQISAGEMAGAKDQFNKGLASAGNVLRNFQVKDVMGAGPVFAAANANANYAAKSGARIIERAGQLDPYGFTAMATANRQGPRGLGFGSGNPLGLGSGGSMFGHLGGSLGFGGSAFGHLGDVSLGGAGGAAYNQSGNIWSGGSYLNPEADKKDPTTEVRDEVAKGNSKLQELIDVWTE